MRYEPIQKVARGDHRIHEGIRERLCSRASSQMINDYDAARGIFAILPGEKIPLHKFDAWAVVRMIERLVQTLKTARRPNQTPHISETSTLQGLQQLLADIPGTACHQNLGINAYKRV